MDIFYIHAVGRSTRVDEIHLRYTSKGAEDERRFMEESPRFKGFEIVVIKLDGKKIRKPKRKEPRKYGLSPKVMGSASVGNLIHLP